MANRYNLNTNIEELSGIGKARAEKLNKLGIRTLEDLLLYFPRTYENRADVKLLGEYDTENPRGYILTIAGGVTNAKLKNRMTISKFRAFDESGSCEVIFFNSPYVKDVFRVGDVFRFYGKTSFGKNGRLALINPKYEPQGEAPLDDFTPIYPLTDGVSSKLLEKLVKSVIDDIAPYINDFLPENIRQKLKLPTYSYAIKNAHFPTDKAVLSASLRRLAFNEMFLFALGISMSAKNRVTAEGVKFSPCSIKPLTDSLPYELTNAQKRAVNDIYKDTVLSSKNGVMPAMARILVGDVGCGKTVCAAIAVYIAAKSNYQSALMVPTEILANQHYEDIGGLLCKFGIRVRLLTASAGAAEKRKIYEEIENGDCHLVIGTHALLNDKVSFKNLGLIVTDEQHRFGVKQRGVLKNRSEKAHMLVMSATPIPRTLALALYGDLDISRIDEMPKGRQRVDTFLVGEAYRSRLNKFIENQVLSGGRCYIVCPAIEGKEDESSPYVSYEGVSGNMKNATEYADELKKALPNLKIATLHGKMKGKEKDEIMNAFAKGETDVLVSTTVIEVGVNVPSATLMIIENAERFGLSQLHQLRGRVGRGNKKSYCILVSDAKNETSLSRLEVMKTTYDGYEISEKDLLLRGPGDFFSQFSNDNLRQSGGFTFKFASMCDDTSLFDLAFSEAKALIERDPELKDADNADLSAEVKKRVTGISDIS